MNERAVYSAFLGMMVLAVVLTLSLILVKQNQNLTRRAAEPTKITICHLPPGNPDNAQMISTDLNAWETGHSPHNAHALDFVVDGTRACPPLPTTPTPSVASPTPTTPSQDTPTPTPTWTE